MRITASKLFDYLQCPHKVWRDAYGPQEEKIKESNPFVELLWERGVSYEKEVISKIGEYLDLSQGDLNGRFQRTIDAMNKKTPLIFQGVLMKDNLVGIPDLIRLMPNGQYAPIDIKSGMATEGGDDGYGGKLKDHYAVQIALYSDALIRLGFENKRQGYIYDIKGDEVLYDFTLPKGKVNKTTLWEFYNQIKDNVEVLLANEEQNKPAMAGACKMCPWYSSCKKWVQDNDDPSGLFYVGRSKRDILSEDLQVYKIDDILSIDLEDLMEQKDKDKTFLKGVGESTLSKIIRRAKVFRVTKEPVLYKKIEFPKVSYELYFDIETDPTKDFVYMHGIYERGPKGERFIDFTAKEINLEEEKNVWSDFWKYIKSLPQDDFAVYYYSAYEKTTYKKMQKMYPDVISEDEVNAFFDNPNVIDLYSDIVLKDTDWPVGSYSIKALAQYCGFSWRDETPSGALSIQWFNKYIETKDEKILERILEYNEDDCIATMVLKDKIEELSEKL